MPKYGVSLYDKNGLLAHRTTGVIRIDFALDSVTNVDERLRATRVEIELLREPVTLSPEDADALARTVQWTHDLIFNQGAGLYRADKPSLAEMEALLKKLRGE